MSPIIRWYQPSLTFTFKNSLSSPLYFRYLFTIKWLNHTLIVGAICAVISPPHCVEGVTAPNWFEYVLKLGNRHIKHRGSTHVFTHGYSLPSPLFRFRIPTGSGWHLLGAALAISWLMWWQCLGCLSSLIATEVFICLEEYFGQATQLNMLFRPEGWWCVLPSPTLLVGLVFTFSFLIGDACINKVWLRRLNGKLIVLD